MAILLLQVGEAALAQGEPRAAVRPFLRSEAAAFLLSNARVIDGTGSPAREGQSIAIENGVITAIGAAGNVDTPAGAEVIDLAGDTILPGLVMLHEHIAYSSGNGGSLSADEILDSHPNSIPKLLLAAGVTTARTAGAGTPQADINLQRRIERGTAVGPTLFVTGPFLNGPRGFRDPILDDFVVETAEEAREVVRFWVRQGATSVKAYENLGPEALRGAIEEAHRLGAHVAGHLGAGTSCAEAAELGIDTIEHAFGSCLLDLFPLLDADGRLDLEEHGDAVGALIDTLVGHGVVLVATPFDGPRRPPPPEELEEILSMLSPQWRSVIPPLAPESLPPGIPEFVFNRGETARTLERRFVAAGGRLLVGADAMYGAVPGYANHLRLIALVEAGFTPLEVIRMVSSDAAAFLEIGESTGRIAVGLEADLLVVRGAPDLDIYDIRNVEYVFSDGRAFDPKRLREAAKGLVGLH